MGVFTRPDSRYYWLWLETKPTGPKREKTAILIGKTASERQDSKRQADAAYRKRMDQIAAGFHEIPGSREDIGFTDYAAIYERDVVPHHKGARREREMLAVLKAAFGDEPIASIDKARVQQWMTERRQKVSARTVNRELDVLKSMLREAAPKYVAASLIVGMKRLTIVQPVRRILSPEQEADLLKAATDPADHALIVVGMDALIRLGDLIDLQRTDRHGVWLTVRDPKGGTPYEVPLSPRAQAALDAIPGRAPYYFARYRTAKNPRDWPERARKRIKSLCKQADIPYGQRRGGITFHWLTRRTGATRLLIAKKQPIPVVQQLGDWKHPDVLLEIYSEAQREDLLAAVGLTGSGAGVKTGGRRRKVAKRNEGASGQQSQTRLQSSK